MSKPRIIVLATGGTIAGIALGFPVAIYSIYHQVRTHFLDKDEKNSVDK